jgi:hypothetical protein
MKRLLTVAGIVGLVAGCGPSAVQQRACDMYVETGGLAELDVAELAKEWSSPEKARELAGINAVKPEESFTAQTWAERIAEVQREKNERVRRIVGQRMTLSLREVDAAMKKCGPKT